MTAKFGLKLGFFAPTIKDQLAEQGLRPVLSADAAHWQADREAIKRLTVRGILTTAESDRACRRLMRVIGQSVKLLDTPP